MAKTGLLAELRELLTDRGAALLGCADLAPLPAEVRNGLPRADRQRESFFDAFACCESAQESARRIGIEHTICGICVAVCPHTKRYTNA